MTTRIISRKPSLVWQTLPLLVTRPQTSQSGVVLREKMPPQTPSRQTRYLKLRPLFKATRTKFSFSSSINRCLQSTKSIWRPLKVVSEVSFYRAGVTPSSKSVESTLTIILHPRGTQGSSNSRPWAPTAKESRCITKFVISHTA
jgi:hypothetical protein